MLATAALPTREVHYPPIRNWLDAVPIFRMQKVIRGLTPKLLVSTVIMSTRFVVCGRTPHRATRMCLDQYEHVSTSYWYVSRFPLERTFCYVSSRSCEHRWSLETRYFTSGSDVAHPCSMSVFQVSTFARSSLIFCVTIMPTVKVARASAVVSSI